MAVLLLADCSFSLFYAHTEKTGERSLLSSVIRVRCVSKSIAIEVDRYSRSRTQVLLVDVLVCEHLKKRRNLVV